MSPVQNKAQEALDLLEHIVQWHRPAVLASSLGAEDMVLTDLIARHALPIELITLDTRRLHGDTLELLARIRRRYDIELRIYRPDPAALLAYTQTHGIDAFYDSVELRKRCCAIRKLEPLARALAGQRAWITGLRREQSTERAEVAIKQFDAIHGMPKFNPLVDWSETDVWDYIGRHDVPYNPLHDQGYRSIGCAPCTRPVRPGEDPRAGRWWWESGAPRECGLHLAPDGRLARTKRASELEVQT